MDNYEQIFLEKTGENYNEFFLKHYDNLVKFLYSHSKDLQKSKDLAQESFFNALLKIEKYDPTKAKFITWLYKVAMNLGHTKRQKEEKLEVFSLNHTEDTEECVMNLSSYDDYNDDDDDDEPIVNMSAIKQEIIKLPPKYRQIITMRFIDELAYKEIAYYLNISDNTVKTRIRKGREILKESLSKHLQPIEEEKNYIDNDFLY